MSRGSWLDDGPRGAVATLVALLLTLLLTACGPAVSVTVGRVPAAAAPKTALIPAAGARPYTEASQRAQPSLARFATSDGFNFALLRLPPATTLSIPVIGLTVQVRDIASAMVDGHWVWPVPHDEAGHHLGTANPGEPGNVVISGHVETRSGAGIFARLQELKPGDTLSLESADGQFTYQVESIAVVPQDDVSVLFQAPEEQVTLITCLPDGIFEHRIIVRAARL